MKDSRIILLKYINTKKEFNQFVSKYSLYNGKHICCRSLFLLMGFNDKVLSTAIKRYAKSCNIQDIIIVQNKGVKYYLVTESEAYLMVEYFKKKNLVYGHGIRDVDFPVKVDGKLIPSYRKWCGMLERCYSESWHKGKPSYKNCNVDPEWLFFSNFHKWFQDNYVEGYVLDKDILNKGNKTYSRKHCVFVPARINGIIINRQNDRGKYPQGVTHRKDRTNKCFEAACSDIGKRYHIGFFDSPEEAFYSYKAFKENLLQKVAKEYFDDGHIKEDVYCALSSYIIEIND